MDRHTECHCRHIERVHSLEVRWYCCHECPIKYRKSYRLTKHLKEAHRLQLPSGHTRFHYTQDEDGCYRLQMVRYEAVDEENVSPVQETNLLDKKYKIKLDCAKSLAEVEVSFIVFIYTDVAVLKILISTSYCIIVSDC